MLAFLAISENEPQSEEQEGRHVRATYQAGQSSGSVLSRRLGMGRIRCCSLCHQGCHERKETRGQTGSETPPCDGRLNNKLIAINKVRN